MRERLHQWFKKAVHIVKLVCASCKGNHWMVTSEFLVLRSLIGENSVFNEKATKSRIKDNICI